MRVLQMGQPLTIDVAEWTDPVATANEALIAVDAVGLCGSDIHGFSGETDRRPSGMVMGHELGGRVLNCATRPDLVGRVVTVNPVLSCGTCRWCLEDQPQVCPQARTIGVDPKLQGAFAEMIAVPVDNVVVLDTTDPRVAALTEPLAVGLHAAELAEVAGKSVLVLGAGAIGLMVVVAVKRLGAAAVLNADPLADRLQESALLGAQVPDTTVTDFAEWATESIGNRVDVVIDAVGSTNSLRTAFAATRAGGTVVVVGMGSPEVSIALFDIVTRERTVIGSFCYGRRVFRTAAGWLSDGISGAVDLIKDVVDLQDAERALSRLADGSEHAPRIMLSPSGRCLSAATAGEPS